MDTGTVRYRRASDEQDDLLATAQLVAGNPDLEARIMARLVDRLLDGLFADLLRQYEDGELNQVSYQLAIVELAGQARQAGLSPFSTP